MYHNEILQSIIESNKGFAEKLMEFLRVKRLKVADFCSIAGIPKSTFYKIISNPNKDFRVSLLRQIIQAIMKIEGSYREGITVAVITTREALNVLRKEIKIGREKIMIKEYPANTIEEEIIQGIKAEREGAKGIICGPVAATTIEKVVQIPVVSFSFRENVLEDAIRNIIKKV